MQLHGQRTSSKRLTSNLPIICQLHESIRPNAASNSLIEQFESLETFCSRRAYQTLKARQGQMTCCTGEVRIEDPRNHPAETVLGLRDILSGGATIVPDPKRLGFYEVHGDSLVYYIHVSPVNGNVLLLATWQNETQPAQLTHA